jgi:ABC-type transport system involved in multi-copper enzyme maturation permease subunit
VAHKLCSTATRTLAVATYGDITRRPLYYILLFSAALLIFGSKHLSLFSFYQEMNLVREMGIATLTLWALIIIIIAGIIAVTQELEDRTAVTLLSKPLHRHEFLLGKFGGVFLSLVPGMLFLAGVLFLTLHSMAASNLPVYDRDVEENLKNGIGPAATAWRVAWDEFVAPQGSVVLSGLVLSLLQSAVLVALAVSFAAFFPAVVSVAATLLAFVLGNMSGYMVASVESAGLPPLAWAAQAGAYVLPNFGYFNLQTHFSEGTIIGARYLGWALLYTGLYVGSVFLVSCSLFRKREVR